MTAPRTPVELADRWDAQAAAHIARYEAGAAVSVPVRRGFDAATVHARQLQAAAANLREATR